MAPSLGHIARIQRHAREPRPWCARLGVTQVVGANAALRHAIASPRVIEFRIRREVLAKLRCRNESVIAEIDLAEAVTLRVLDVPRHVHAEEERRAVVQ